MATRKKPTVEELQAAMKLTAKALEKSVCGSPLGYTEAKEIFEQATVLTAGSPHEFHRNEK